MEDRAVVGRIVKAEIEAYDTAEILLPLIGATLRSSFLQQKKG